MSEPTPCPNCGSENVYESEEVPAVGAYSPDFLPGLGNAINRSKFTMVTCADCGFTRFFAGERSRSKLASSSKWHKLSGDSDE